MCHTPKQISSPRRYRLAEIYELYFSDYIRSENRELRLRDKHFTAVDKSISCRTKKLGICEIVCRGCGEVKEIKRSCKHRFCGHCGSWSTNRWADKTLKRLLNIPHHHVIMTLPKAYRKLSKMNGDKLHDALFRSSAMVLQSWFKERYNLKVGIVSVLHTAGSDLKYHPHVHMIVSRGGRELEGENYRQVKGNYLCPQRELGRRLRELFMKELMILARGGQLRLYRRTKTLAEFKGWMEQMSMKHWIVSIQEPLADVKQIVQYVGRYSKRACLSELKILSIEEGISFKYNAYKNTPRGSKPQVGICRMDSVEFLDKLLQHVPNKGYKMVRYYGLYNSVHLKNIPCSWKLSPQEMESISLEGLETEMAIERIEETEPYAAWRRVMILSTGVDPMQCPYCNELRVVYQMVYETKTIVLYEEDTS